MKKIICICAAGLMIAAMSTSCNKKCECKTYVNGVVMSTNEVELDEGKSCKDLTNLLTEDPKTGVECKGTL